MRVWVWEWSLRGQVGVLGMLWSGSYVLWAVFPIGLLREIAFRANFVQ